MGNAMSDKRREFLSFLVAALAAIAGRNWLVGDELIAIHTAD
jgi:hypothetical protein